MEETWQNSLTKGFIINNTKKRENITLFIDVWCFTRFWYLEYKNCSKVTFNNGGALEGLILLFNDVLLYTYRISGFWKEREVV